MVITKVLANWAFTWEGIHPSLPEGVGLCLDVGCGDGRHCDLVEKAGWDWIGLDVDSERGGAIIVGDGIQIPFLDESFEMVLLWQVLEHLPKPTVVLNEVTRVLKPNGQVYGSVSCLEPFHDICSYYGFTHKGIEQILTDCGFTDIEIQPGINAFSLITRSWLRHLLVPSKVVEWSCFFLVRALFIPSLWLYLFSRKLLNLLRRGKLGTDYKSTVKWLSEDAPLEFAGHLMFKARKAG